jgi:uncharacterized protein (DUF1684 family)
VPGSAELAVADWRRRTFAAYSTVREQSNPATAHEMWISHREHMLAEHPSSPVPPDQRSKLRVSVAPYNPSYRFVVPMLEAAPERREVQTGTDGRVVLERIGRVHLDGLGSLDVWWHAGYGGGVFLPVHDATSGATSYGGGRYVLDTIKGADLGGDESSLVVDLNFAYNPSCAYDPAWACPLPAQGNRLDVAVPVGELG